MNAATNLDTLRKERMTRMGLLAEPAGYVDGTNLYEYVGSNPTASVDPFGLQWFKDMGCKNDCEGVLEALIGGIPALPEGGRLDKARQQSGLDFLTMLAQAFKESSFDPNAKAPNSSATGLWQILDGTADDIQDRIWRNFISRDNPMVPGGGRFRDHRTNPYLAATGYYAYLLDRIASAGGDLRKGLERYFGGEGKEDYADKVLKGRDAIRKTCGLGENPTVDQIRNCLKEKCDEIKKVLEATVR